MEVTTIEGLHSGILGVLVIIQTKVCVQGVEEVALLAEVSTQASNQLRCQKVTHLLPKRN